MSIRTERVASVIRDTVAEAIQQRLSDPRLEPLTSVTRVEVAADFSIARVFVSVMAPEARRTLSVKALHSARGRIRTMVAHRLSLRQVPEIDFRLDESVRRGIEVVEQIDRIMEQTRMREEADADKPSDDPADPPPRTVQEDT